MHFYINPHKNPEFGHYYPNLQMGDREVKKHVQGQRVARRRLEPRSVGFSSPCMFFSLGRIHLNSSLQGPCEANVALVLELRKLRFAMVRPLGFGAGGVQKWWGWQWKPRPFLLLGQEVGDHLRKHSALSPNGRRSSRPCLLTWEQDPQTDQSS